MWKPASTCTTSPVVERPRSDSSHRAQPAIPSGAVSSRRGAQLRPWLIMLRPPDMPASERVRTAPAEIALTRIFFGPRSRAM